MSTILARLHRFSTVVVRPVVSGLLVALILALGLLSVRPDLHELVCRHHNKATSHSHAHHAHEGHSPSGASGHHDPGSDDRDGCAVSLFGHGHVLLLTPAVLTLPDTRHAGTFATFEATILARTAHLLPQGHAPPAV